MKLITRNVRHAVGVAALSAGVLGMGGCGDEDGDGLISQVADQCNLKCDAAFVDAQGDLTGQADITGTAAVDGFFDAVIDFTRVGGKVSQGIITEVNGIKNDFGIEADADFEAEFSAKADTYLDGGFEVVVQEPVCTVDAQATIDASAKCDVEVDPGKVEVQCMGSCEAEVKAEVDCGVDVDASCTFQAPSVACEGSCTGSCTVEAPSVSCEGTCSGSCSGSCTVELNVAASCDGMCTGTCDGDMVDGANCNGNCKGSCELTGNAAASCTGSCDGMCEGSCTTDAGGVECSGSCQGSCEVTGPELDCEGAVEARCEGSADAMVSCEGSCDGEVVPPKVKAECEAQVEARASLEVDCKPPSIQIEYRLKAGVNLEADADAKAFVQGLANLRTRLPKLKAAVKRAGRLQGAARNLGTAGKVAVKGAIDTVVDGKGDFAAKVKLGCALNDSEGNNALNLAADAVVDTADQLKMAGDETVDVFAAFKI